MKKERDENYRHNTASLSAQINAAKKENNERTQEKTNTFFFEQTESHRCHYWVLSGTHHRRSVCLENTDTQ